MGFRPSKVQKLSKPQSRKSACRSRTTQPTNLAAWASVPRVTMGSAAISSYSRSHIPSGRGVPPRLVFSSRPISFRFKIEKISVISPPKRSMVRLQTLF